VEAKQSIYKEEFHAQRFLPSVTTVERWQQKSASYRLPHRTSLGHTPWAIEPVGHSFEISSSRLFRPRPVGPARGAILENTSGG
jgi:hypothetical protein